MLIPSSKYPAQTAVDLVNYPQGKARNVTASGDGLGTPWEKDLINDIWGFFQGLVLQAGITPTGTPDTAPVSQLVQAVQALVLQGTVAYYTITPSVATAAGSAFPLTLVYQRGGYALAANAVTVPAAGKYRVAFNGAVQCNIAGNPQTVRVDLYQGGTDTGIGVESRRFSATTGDDLYLSAEAIVTIVAPGSQALSINSAFTSGLFSSLRTANLVIERVG